MRLGILICTIATGAAACVGSVVGKTWHVGEGHPFRTVRSAIDAASPGDTVVVHPGVYREKNLLIEKRIALLGTGRPVLDGEGNHEVVSIRADGVTLSGFLIRNSGVSSMTDPAAVRIVEASDVVIHDNEIRDAFFGIYSQYGKRCRITSNRLEARAIDEQQSGNGIHCWYSDSLLVADNHIKGHRDGVYFEFVTQSLVKGNTSEGNLRYGLHFMFSNDDAYESNTFSSNGAGVAVMFSKRVRMSDNEFTRNWGDASYGILLKEISDGTIERNRFSRNTSGIMMEGASRIRMEDNDFLDNGWALKIQASCMDIETRRNNFIGNSFDVSTNGSLVLNSFNGNYWDRYEGYDIDRDRVGDVPYRPVSLFSVILERNPIAMVMFRSFISLLMDRAEKLIPSLTPEGLKDEKPLMKPVAR